MPNIDLSILNQRQTPAFYASSLATRPAFGFAGRIFIDTDSPSTGLYRDTGAAWVQIADPGAGTTGTLQQVTTNGNTTSQGINITAGGLSSNIVTIAANGLGSVANYIGQTMATNDNWKIYGAGSTIDQGELVFQVGDGGQPYASNGQRFRFNYDVAGGSGTPKDVFIVDYDLSYFNTSLGINTDTPTAAFDVHSGVNVIAQLNQTVATNNSLLAFQNNNAGLWRIGNFYNAGANDWGIFDVIGAIQPVTVKKTTGQVLIGTSTVGSGKLVVASATGDNGVQIVGASAPSLRIDNAESGPTKRVGLGISTATNNFIQGSADRDFCIFNGSTTASPILFGIYGTTNVQEAARISAARNFLIGTTTDAGQKLQVSGTALITGATTFNSSITATNITNNGIYYGKANASFPSTSLGYFALKTNNFDAERGGLTIQVLNSVSTFVDALAIDYNGAATFSNNVIASNGRFFVVNTFGYYFGDINNLTGWQGSNGTGIIQGFTSGSEKMRIVSGGNVLIGTTTDLGFKLQVNGLIVSIDDYISSRASSNSTQYGFVNLGDGNLYLGSVGVGAFGRFNMTTGVYVATSDKNKKKNFEPSNLGLDAVLKLKPTLYNMTSQKDNEAKELGFIAQEVKEVIEQAYVENGEFIGLNYQPIVAALVKAIQDLNIKIENLKN